MKPRFKVFWLKEVDKETNKEFVEHLDDGWMIFNCMPTEKVIWVVITKMTDALDGLAMKVDSVLISEK